ncbi:MAG: DUF2062 domain-containing protein [Chromatiales bacterium]|jgi:uncharacterized protein (DUF2062 family)
MPKKFFRKFTPDHEAIRNHKHMRIFGRFLLDPNLWHLNRRSVSGAFAVGLFWAMIPIPLQMLAAAATAIGVRVNLPISVALVWLTNPLTMPPIFYFNYLLGAWLLNKPENTEEFHPTMEWLMHSMEDIWQPLYFGSLVTGLALALAGYVLIRLSWRLHIISRLKNRRAAIRQQQQ